ncbi:solute carrier family 35 member G1-like [Apostichopus japonicus]|uniref:solute carrier family 35 member G1-like n=1 Tax=Stichopus japonicus TaxID=307972 RepID=UPI003AB27E40
MVDRMNISTAKGAAYMIMFGAVASVQAALSKAMIDNGSNAFELVFIRCVIHLFVILTFTSWTSTVSYTLVDMFLYICCTSTAVISWIATNLSFCSLGVGDSIAIETGASVLLTTFVGHIWLSERVDITDIPILLMNIIGVILVVKPSMIFEPNAYHKQGQIMGAVFALAAGILCAIYPVTVKFIARKETFNINIFLFFHGITGIPITLVITALFSTPWKPSYSLDNCLMTLVYQMFCLAQTSFFALALELEDATYVAFASTISCVLTYLAQLTIFKATLEWLAIVGSLLILSALTLFQIRQIRRKS